MAFVMHPPDTCLRCDMLRHNISHYPEVFRRGFKWHTQEQGFSDEPTHEDNKARRARLDLEAERLQWGAVPPPL